jgi:dTDP-N-acetylfucosamine:lipid II N-acetylfucosaminyltransferase
MQSFKYLHIMQNEKFIGSFIEFINKHFNSSEHFFIILGGLPESKHTIPQQNNILVLDSKFGRKINLVKLSKILNPYFKEAQKVIIHSLFVANILDFLFLNQKYLQKSYWVIWGGDLYDYTRKADSLRKRFVIFRKKTIIRKMKGFITYIKGDYELAKKWYSASGEYRECFMYPSNLYKEYDIPVKLHDTVNIQIGNSADPANNHLKILEKLEQYKDENIKIYAPLSYGDMEYAKMIADKGKETFGEKFVAMLDFMPFEEYMRFLGEIDIAIFFHKRQQAMGNIVTLLGLGKKVYMRSDITSWQLFEDIDVKVFDVGNIEIDLIDEQIKKENQEKVKEYFSKENYLQQLNNLFES